ncbi:MAG TPA: fluoride efflux transporter CrcB [Candidatus Thermoplasmatota archaeon]|nr:fluoride efflux transporter CrcB [Candidatus Thermoplasmatota archaeon]
MVPVKDFALVALGGALGCVARFAVSTYMPRLEFPWHTLLVNLAGSFVLGFLFLDHGMEHNTRLLVAVGFLGGFTTLSTFSVETIDLAKTGRQGLALANLLANGLGGPLVAFAGWRLAVVFT